MDVSECEGRKRERKRERERERKREREREERKRETERERDREREREGLRERDREREREKWYDGITTCVALMLHNYNSNSNLFFTTMKQFCHASVTFKVLLTVKA